MRYVRLGTLIGSLFLQACVPAKKETITNNDIGHTIGKYSRVCTSELIANTDIYTDKRLPRSFYPTFEDIDRDGRADFRYRWVSESGADKVIDIEVVTETVPMCDFRVTRSMRFHSRGSLEADAIEKEMRALAETFEAPPTPEKQKPAVSK